MHTTLLLSLASVASAGVWVATDLKIKDDSVDENYVPGDCKPFATDCEGTNVNDIDCSYKDIKNNDDVLSYSWKHFPDCTHVSETSSYQVVCNKKMPQLNTFTDGACTEGINEGDPYEQECAAASYQTNQDGADEIFYEGFKIAGSGGLGSGFLCVEDAIGKDNQPDSSFTERMRNVLRNGKKTGKKFEYASTAEFSTEGCSGDPNVGTVSYALSYCRPVENSGVVPATFADKLYRMETCNTTSGKTFWESRLYSGDDCDEDTMVETFGNEDFTNNARSYYWSRSSVEMCQANGYAEGMRNEYNMKYQKVSCSDSNIAAPMFGFAMASFVLSKIFA